MTTAPFTSLTTSNGPIATHCSISIVSNFVPPNLVTTKISPFLLYSKFLILRVTSKFHVYQSVVTSSMHSRIYHAPIFKATLLFSPTSDSIPPVEQLRGSFHPEIRQGSLKITTPPHSLDNTRRACLKNGQHFPYTLNF